MRSIPGQHQSSFLKKKKKKNSISLYSTKKVLEANMKVCNIHKLLLEK